MTGPATSGEDLIARIRAKIARYSGGTSAEDKFWTAHLKATLEQHVRTDSGTCAGCEEPRPWPCARLQGDAGNWL